MLKTILGASALCLAMIPISTTPAAAQDINIYVHGEDGPQVGPGPQGGFRGPNMRGPNMRGPNMRGPREPRREVQGMRCGPGGPGMGPNMRHDARWGGPHGHGGGHGGRMGGRMGGGRGMDRVLDLIELYDQDGDGKVTQAEIDKARADRLAAYDADGNGSLSLQEYEKLWLEAMRSRMVDQFQAHDDDGDGQVTVNEFSKRTSRLVLRRDNDEDGAIDLTDARRNDRGRPPVGKCDGAK